MATVPHAGTISSSCWTAEHDIDALLARIVPKYRGHSITSQLKGKLKNASRSMGDLEDWRFHAKPHAEAVHSHDSERLLHMTVGSHAYDF